MPFGFPANPTLGQLHPVTNPLFQFRGVIWEPLGGSGVPGTATRIRTPEFMPNVKTSYPAHTAAHEELATDLVNCQLVPTADLPLVDQHHWSGGAHVTLGQRMAAL